MSTNLNRRLSALEEIAEQCRVREMRESIGDEIVRRSREHGVMSAPGQLGAKIDRALAVWMTAEALLAAGLTMDAAARHLAVQHEVDPDRLVALYHDLRATRGEPA
jgi:hypothetical protein